jgi:hypothetical protein
MGQVDILELQMVLVGSPDTVFAVVGRKPNKRKFIHRLGKSSNITQIAIGTWGG